MMALLLNFAMATTHVDYYHDKIVIENDKGKYVYILSEEDKKLSEDELVKKVILKWEDFSGS